MALADEKGSKSGFKGNGFNGLGAYSSVAMTLESFEARQLLAFNPVGAVGTLTPTATGQIVESAAATPNINNAYRYATVVGPNGTTLNVVPVIGPDSSTPGTPISITLPANGVVSNTDVAANTNGNLFVVTYEVTVTTPPGPGVPGGTDSDIYAAVVANGTIVGTPSRVNAVTNGNQSNSRVAMDGSGNFVVVWGKQHRRQRPGWPAVQCQRRGQRGRIRHRQRRRGTGRRLQCVGRFPDRVFGPVGFDPGHVRSTVQHQRHGQRHTGHRVVRHLQRAGGRHRQ